MFTCIYRKSLVLFMITAHFNQLFFFFNQLLFVCRKQRQGLKVITLMMEIMMLVL